jgi:hypothetical protein
MINGIAPILGFEKRDYPPEYVTHLSEKAVNLNTINSIKVMCNIVQGSLNNHLQSHTIYEFFPSCMEPENCFEIRKTSFHNNWVTKGM